MKNQRTRKGLAAVAVIAVSSLGLAACASDDGGGRNDVSGDAPGKGKPECAQLEQFGLMYG